MIFIISVDINKVDIVLDKIIMFNLNNVKMI